MGYFDFRSQYSQQVCLNGHQLTDEYEAEPNRSKFCEMCGEEAITRCPSCNQNIKGYQPVEGVISGCSAPVPSHCGHCGKPFPWTERKTMEKVSVEKNEFHNVILVLKICTRFHIVAKQLRIRHDKRAALEIKDEYDVQDLLHGLLKIHFDDIRPEEWTPSYAGGCSRVDFLLKKEQIIIEVKKTRDTLRQRQIGEQLIIDKERYKSHPDCKTLVCFVYDPDESIPNPRGLESDLSKDDGSFKVVVLVIPKGT